MTSSESAGPLEGVVVLDLSRVLAGPYATMLLADLGATVIKVESPQGDETRTWRPPERDGESTYFQAVNRNKRSIALDLGSAADAEIVEQLLGRADVLVENFKPGGLARFGLDYDSVRTRFPQLIYASLSGFGFEGPGAELPGLRRAGAGGLRADARHRRRRGSAAESRRRGGRCDQRAAPSGSDSCRAARTQRLRCRDSTSKPI